MFSLSRRFLCSIGTVSSLVKMKAFIVLFFLNNLYLFALCSECHSRKTCGSCIGVVSERCVWCTQENLKDDVKCQPETMPDLSKWCNKEFIYNPTSVIDVKKNESFRATPGKEIQFLPQELYIKVRPGITVPFTMSFKPSKDFPLDVYFVLDYSYTMRFYNRRLKSESLKIFNELKAITKNVHLGVGSFIEKPGLPYADINHSNSYSFINHLSLTEDFISFQREIENPKFGGNYDIPEAGLDALMQAMTCVEEIGWRQYTRRIIVLMTDSTYHSAGDGKMVGAYRPNDMQCHLKKNEYKAEESLLYDYPSVSQINYVAMNGHFKIIFAVVDEVMDEYKALASQIKNAECGNLNGNSIVNIIIDTYKEMMHKVDLSSTLQLPNVDLKIDQNCAQKPMINCESNQISPRVDIPAHLTVTACTSETSHRKIFYINPSGIKDTLTIHLEIDCRCPCEEEKGEMVASCSWFGFKQCGICKCIETRHGDACQFDKCDASTSPETCKENKNDKNLCSGHGICKCGRCEHCDKGFSGEFCQYSLDMCPRVNKFLCNDHGDCRFGKCECNKGWSGEDCTCSEDTESCIAPFTSKICSGHGNCECGTCKCETVPNKNETYTGAFCENCAECFKEMCKSLAPYAECNYYNETTDCYKHFNRTDQITVMRLNKTEIESSKWEHTTKCTIDVTSGMILIFKYQVNEDSKRVRLLIQKELEEAPKANVWLAAGISIGTILLIGIVTLIVWKILIDLYDKREYEKFCKEAKEDGYTVNQNPLYQPVVDNFENPAYLRDQ